MILSRFCVLEDMRDAETNCYLSTTPDIATPGENKNFAKGFKTLMLMHWKSLRMEFVVGRLCEA
jgi:hypothetical protein